MHFNSISLGPTRSGEAGDLWNGPTRVRLCFYHLLLPFSSLSFAALASIPSTQADFFLLSFSRQWRSVLIRYHCAAASSYMGESWASVPAGYLFSGASGIALGGRRGCAPRLEITLCVLPVPVGRLHAWRRTSPTARKVLFEPPWMCAVSYAKGDAVRVRMRDEGCEDAIGPHARHADEMEDGDGVVRRAVRGPRVPMRTAASRRPGMRLGGAADDALVVAAGGLRRAGDAACRVADVRAVLVSRIVQIPTSPCHTVYLVPRLRMKISVEEDGRREQEGGAGVWVKRAMRLVATFCAYVGWAFSRRRHVSLVSCGTSTSASYLANATSREAIREEGLPHAYSEETGSDADGAVSLAPPPWVRVGLDIEEDTIWAAVSSSTCAGAGALPNLDVPLL
ncbi:hypothetical protein C8R46DRAFT_1218961 [Mycena filopes]|nr:hypothetical protein C8R46DRAFT_1218961 [Mycena filopes]